ncbi:MAG: LysM peptidoglycan-binding domain-containing protein, partial [Anaerolineae bacterium]|nr:LysM peptidoglycan-binding domain-containing protein [Anaerolineae bacterium]
QIPLPFAVRSQPYIVRRGDTVSELAVRFTSRRDQWNAWMDAFVLANQIEDRNLIITRQVVWIPILTGGVSDDEQGDNLQSFQLCWLGDQGNSSSWNIYNPHPVPLLTNPERKVRFNWYALDDEGKILQQGKRWENQGITRHNTVKASSLKVEWYLVSNNQEGEIIGTTVIEAREEFRCDDDWPRKDPPISDELSPLRHPYAWHLIAPQLQDWPMKVESSVQRYPAATLLPVPRDQASSENEYPVSFCISPYVGMDFARAKIVEPRLIYAELLCLDPRTQKFTTVASQLYDLEAIFIQAGENLKTADFPAKAADIYTAESIGWAREIQRRLAPDTPIAVLRFRTINKAKDTQAGEAALTTTYAFSLVNDLKVQERLSRRMFSIRTTPGELRYRQGHYGGHQMPQDVRPFEAAPPQTTGVQPIYFTERPHAPIDPDVREADWPWGISALRMSVQYTEGKQGVVGSTGENGDQAPTTLWWQAPQHQVQFRTQTEDERPTGGLPKKFRAPAIRSMLPVLPDAPLPTVDADAEFSTAITDETFMEKWQPVLPGNLRYLLLGNRAGAMFAFRNMLLRQSNLIGNSTGEGLVSGSIPVQHRVPRPVPLPPNVLPEYALQTWASRFEPQHNSLVTESPADEAFFADVPMRRMKITLSSPVNGVVMPGWTGDVLLEFVSDMGEGWIPEPATIAEYFDLQLIQGNQQPRNYAKMPQDLWMLKLSLNLETMLPADDMSDPQTVTPTWIAQFESVGVTISDTATVQHIDPVGGVPTWRLHDADGNPYLIAKIGGQLRVCHEEDRFKLRFTLTGLTDEEKRTGIVN